MKVKVNNNNQFFSPNNLLFSKPPTLSEIKKEGREADLYSAFIVVPHT